MPPPTEWPYGIKLCLGLELETLSVGWGSPVLWSSSPRRGEQSRDSVSHHLWLGWGFEPSTDNEACTGQRVGPWCGSLNNRVRQRVCHDRWRELECLCYMKRLLQLHQHALDSAFLSLCLIHILSPRARAHTHTHRYTYFAHRLTSNKIYMLA